MKIRLEVSSEKYEKLSETLLTLGFEIDEDAEYVLSERNCHWEYVSCKKEDKSYHLPVSDIVYFESQGHDIIVYTEEEEYRCSDRLWQLEKSLNPSEFVRISNSVIINRNKIKKIKSALSQKFLITMINGSQVDVTRSYYYIFKSKFGI